MSREVSSNQQALNPPRKAPKTGGIFVYRPKGRGYFLGRVVAIDAQITSMRDYILLALFATELRAKPSPERRFIGDVLVPRCMTNCSLWTRGYFESVAKGAL